MTQPVFFDVVEDNENYHLYVIGDDGYLYVANVIAPNPDIANEVINFNKVDLLNIALNLNNVKFGSMKAVLNPPKGPHEPSIHQVSVAVQISAATYKLYIFQAEFNKPDEAGSWTIKTLDIANTTLCMEYSEANLLTGGVAGINVINSNSFDVSLISNISMVSSLKNIALITFAATEFASRSSLLISSDGFTSNDYQSFSPGSNNGILPSNIGKIIATNNDFGGDITVLLLSDAGISTLGVDLNSTELKITWGKPFLLTDIAKYDYSSSFNLKDLADGRYTINGDASSDIELFMMDNNQSSYHRLLKYLCNTRLNSESIRLTQTSVVNPYYHNKPFDAKVNPKLRVISTRERAFVLSNQMELSMISTNSNERQWIKINLPD